MTRSADPRRRQWWRQLINSFDPQRFTVAEFCQRHRVSVASFYNWRRKLARQDESPRAQRSPSPAFLPVQVVPDPQLSVAKSVQVHLPGGVRIDVPAEHKELLWELIAHVAQPAEATR